MLRSGYFQRLTRGVRFRGQAPGTAFQNVQRIVIDHTGEEIMADAVNAVNQIAYHEGDEHFWTWVRRHWGRALGIVSPFLIPLPFKALEPHLANWLPSPSQYSKVAPYFLNLVTLSILLLFFTGPPRTDHKNHEVASLAVRKFAAWWHRMWWIWFLMYLVMTLLRFPNPLIDAGGGASTDLLTYLKGSGSVPSAHWHTASAFEGAIAFSANACMLMCYLTLAHYRKPERELAGIVAMVFVQLFVPQLIVVSTAYAGQLNEHRYATADLSLSLFYGTIACVSMSVLIGRLESRVIAPPLLVVVVLYVYAALQLVANVLLGAQSMPGLPANTLAFTVSSMAVLLLAAVFLKALLFLLVYWLLHSGVLLYYMHWMLRSSDANSGIEAERKDFLRDPHSAEA